MAQTREEIIIEVNFRYEETLKNIGKLESEIKRIKLDQESFSGELKRGQITEKEYARSLTETNAAIKERESRLRVLNREVQNNIKIENENNGSINSMRASLSNLKAQYSELSKADRENIEIGGKLLKQTADLNAELKEAEQAYGDFQRDVGNYEKATKSLRGELRQYTEELARMIQQGKQGTPEYEALRLKVGEMKDAFDDAAQSIKNTASDTKALEGLNQGVQTLVGSFGLYQSAVGLSDTENKQLAETMKNLQITMAALSSAQAIQNALQKQSSLMQSVSAVQAKALTKAQDFATKGTKAATIAQKAFNLVAMANPYVLLAVALISVIGALALFAFNTDKSAKNQKELNEQQKIWLDYLEAENEVMNRVSNERIAQLQRELDIAKSRNASLAETRKIENEILTERIKAYNQNVGFYAKELEDLEANREKLQQLRDMLVSLQNMQAEGTNKVRIDVDLDGDIEKVKVDEAIEAVQGQIDNIGRSVDIAVNLNTEGADLNAQNKIQVNQRLQENRNIRKIELDEIRKAQDAANELIRNNQERELTILRTGSARQVAELENRLKTEKNLTAAAREAISKQILSIQEKTRMDEAEINKKYSAEEIAKRLADEQAKIDLRLLSVKKGTDEEFALRKTSLENQRDMELSAEKLTETQKALIRSKYARKIDENGEEQAAALRERQAQALANDLNSQLQALGENETAKEQLKLDFAQKTNEQLEALNKEAQIKQFGSEEAYNAAVIESKGKIIEAEKAVQDAALANTQKVFDSIGTIGGAVEELFGSLAEDNEAMAEFTKAIALFNIGVSTAEAIAKGIAGASGVPFPANLAAIATTIATVIANIVKAKQVLSKETTPKAPKFAQGGIVQGVSFTGDNITARVNSGEMILNAAQQARLFSMASGNVLQRTQQPNYELLTNAFLSALSRMPAPVLDYKEFTDFQKIVITHKSDRTI
jgi:hypothetical protein